MAKTFLDWLEGQVDRSDKIGALARDVRSEQARIGRKMSALNSLSGLRHFCSAAPVKIGLTRAIANSAWQEYIEAEKETESADRVAGRFE